VAPDTEKLRDPCRGGLWLQALTVYEQLRSEDEEDEDEADGGRLSVAKTSARAAADDDIGSRFNDQLGLAKRVRERCRQQSEIVRLVMHRETIYQGQPRQPTASGVAR